MKFNAKKCLTVTASLAAAAILFTGCANSEAPAPAPKAEAKITKFAQVTDFTTAAAPAGLNHKDTGAYYTEQLKKMLGYEQDVALLTKDIEIAKMTPNMADWKVHVYKPWDAITVDVKRGLKQNKKRGRINYYYDDGLKPHDPKQVEAILALTNMEAAGEPKFGIVNEEVQVRNLPSNKPWFWEGGGVGEGYPFDYLDESSEHPNVPVTISHYSTDGAWAFVRTPTTNGAWIKSSAIAEVNADQMKEIKSAKKVVITTDHIPMYTTEGMFLSNVMLGAVFPLVKEDADYTYSYIFKTALNGKTKKVNVKIAKVNVDNFPLAFDKAGVEKIAGQLLGQNYGWGGHSKLRDCTSFAKDYFRPFGFWIPRNSGQQNEADETIDLRDLALAKAKNEAIKAGKSITEISQMKKSDNWLNAEDNEAQILKNGIPFVSTIYKGGHIMLYVGKTVKDGQERALIMHATSRARGVRIMKTAISDFYVGEGFDGRTHDDNLAKKLRVLMLKPNYTKYEN